MALRLSLWSSSVEIPRSGLRIMAVADAFSAMTTDRPYRKGMNPLDAIAILERGAGKQWDRDCVAAFIRAWDRVSGRQPQAVG